MGDIKRTGLWLPLVAGLAIGISLGGLVFCGLGVGGFSFGLNELNVRNAGVTSPQVGNIAPDFELLSLTDDHVRLNELQGKVVLVNFWATWCAPCILEMPNFQEAYESYGSELVVVAVNAGESKRDVKSFAEELGLSFPVLLDPEREVEKLYRLRGYPTSFFLDAEGVIQVQHIGTLTEGQLTEYLNQVGIFD